MFYNDWLLQQLAKERRNELLRQAAQERSGREFVRRPALIGQWFNWLGRQLIITGERLQAHHKAAVTMAAMRAAYHRSQTR